MTFFVHCAFLLADANPSYKSLNLVARLIHVVRTLLLVILRGTTKKNNNNNTTLDIQSNFDLIVMFSFGNTS